MYVPDEAETLRHVAAFLLTHAGDLTDYENPQLDLTLTPAPKGDKPRATIRIHPHLLEEAAWVLGQRDVQLEGRR